MRLARRADCDGFTPVQLMSTNADDSASPPILEDQVVSATDLHAAATLTEARLRRSEANLAAAQRIARLGSWELDLIDVGDVTEGALRWSDEVFRIWGYAPGGLEVTYANFLLAVHPDDRELIGDAVAAALKESRAYDLTYRVVHPDGSERVVREQAEFEHRRLARLVILPLQNRCLTLRACRRCANMLRTSWRPVTPPTLN